MSNNFNTLTEIALYLSGGFSYGAYEEYAQIQNQLNEYLSEGTLEMGKL